MDKKLIAIVVLGCIISLLLIPPFLGWFIYDAKIFIQSFRTSRASDSSYQQRSSNNKPIRIDRVVFRP